MRIRFDCGPLSDGPTAGTRFEAPRKVLRADHPDAVASVLAEAEAALAQGLWIAGFASYEAGLTFAERLRPLCDEDAPAPLACFGIYDAPVADPAPSPQKGAAPQAWLSRPRPLWDQARYDAAFSKVKAHLAAGDCYQINLTFPLEAQLTGTPQALYDRLRAAHPLAHGALVELDGLTLVSRSPELFFETGTTGRIRTRPMKGTRPRAADAAQDEALRHALVTSEKDRAENLMIVDLLRNDVSRVSRVGSVRVPDLYTVETYPTVHQMVSTVEAQLLPGIGLAAIFEALFPCGSITGAPKIRAMQIIHALEEAPRGAYCGTIGWAAPDGRSSFNVAIRTLSIAPDGVVRLNVGGGVVQDSQSGNEYEEALWKARFLDEVIA